MESKPPGSLVSHFAIISCSVTLFNKKCYAHSNIIQNYTKEKGSVFMNTLFILLLIMSLICTPVFGVWTLKCKRSGDPAETYKKGTVASAIVLVVSFLGFAFTMEPVVHIESIEIAISGYQTEYDINTEIPVKVTVYPEDAEVGDLEYITSDQSLTFEDSVVTTGASEDTYEICVQSGEITSNTLTISVVDMAERKAEEERLAEEQRLAEEKAAKEAEEKRLAEEQAAKEAEEKRLAEERAAQEAEEQRLAEEKAAQEAAEKAAQEEKARQETAAQGGSSGSGGSNGGSGGSGGNGGNGGTGNGDNFNTYDNAEQQQTTATYVLNTKTHKIHVPTCRDVPKIAPDNYSTSNQSVDELQAQGYTTCGHCF